MTQESLQAEVLAALSASLTSSNTKEIQDVTNILYNLSWRNDYCRTLMMIADGAECPERLRVASLIQLKNVLPRRIHSEEYPIGEHELAIIRQNIITAIDRVKHINKLLKLYREIAETVLRAKPSIWMPINQILYGLQQEEKYIGILNFLIAFASKHHYDKSEQNIAHFGNHFIVILPSLLRYIDNNPCSLVYYFGAKFICKAFKVGLEKRTELYDSLQQCMQCLMNILNDEDSTLITQEAVEDYEEQFEQDKIYCTPRYYYFHAKKWTTKAWEKLVSEVLVYHHSAKEFNAFSKSCYDRFGDMLIATILRQFQIEIPKKLRYHQFRLINCLLRMRPGLLLPYTNEFQHKYLVPYLTMTEEDELMSVRYPVQYLSMELDYTPDEGKCKKLALNIWAQYAEYESRFDGKRVFEAPRLLLSLQHLNYQIRNCDIIAKERALFILYKMRLKLKHSSSAMRMIEELFPSYIMPLFTSQTMLLRGRALDIITSYGEKIKNQNILKGCKDFVMKSLKDEKNFIRLKAAKAVRIISECELLPPLRDNQLQYVLFALVHLVENFDFDDARESLEALLQKFIGSFIKHTASLLKFLTDLFVNTLKKIKTTPFKDSDNIYYSASRIIGILKILFVSKQTQQFNTLLEQHLLIILENIFLHNLQPGNSYFEETMDLLNTHLMNQTIVSRELWFYFYIILFAFAGIPKGDLATLQGLPFTSGQKAIILQFQQRRQMQVNMILPPLRNYIKHFQASFRIPDSLRDIPNILICNPMQMLVYSIYKTYARAGKQNNPEGQDLLLCTYLLIYLLENHHGERLEKVYRHVWSIIKTNANWQSPYREILRFANTQLFCMLFWSAPKKALTFINIPGNELEDYLLRILGPSSRMYVLDLEEFEQRQRAILGLTNIVCECEGNPEVMRRLPTILQALFGLMEQNTRQCLQSFSDNDNSLQDTQTSDEQKKDILLLQDEEEEYKKEPNFVINLGPAEGDFCVDQLDFHEMYETYVSELDGINEIEYFLSRMKDLHNHNAKLYAKLCTTMKCDIIKYIIEEMEIEEDEGDMIMELAS